MRVLLIDVYSSYLDFALRCIDAGHEVRWFQSKTREGLPSKVGNGMVKKVPDWESSMKWADIILLADNVRYLPGLERYRRMGFPIWGPSVETAALELDRMKGQELLKSAGIKIMDSVQFKTLNEAKQYLVHNPARYVSKPCADDNKALSYVSKSPRDMMFMLEKWQKDHVVNGEFIFQKFTPGIEVAVGGWFGRGGFSKYFMENFEGKKLMNDDVGVNTGEMHTVMKYVENSLLADMLLKPLEGELYRKGYTGYIDVAVMVSERGDPLPLEFTCRPGWPLYQIQQSLHKGDPVQWMLDSINGMDTFKVYDEIATGVVMAIPDFPYGTLSKAELTGYPVYGWDKIRARNFHPGEMMLGDVWHLDVAL